MGYGWEGEKVRLVPLDREKHFENCLRWMNDPQATEWTLIGDLPLSRLAEEDFFEKILRQDTKHPTDIALAVETLEGEHIGVSGLHQINWRDRIATTGTIIGVEKNRGRGYGSDAARVRLRYAFDVLDLRMILSEVMADNIKSLRMLEKAGYTEVGRIPRHHWKRGAYRDTIILMIERDA